MKKKALGKGIEALIPDKEKAKTAEVINIKVDHLSPSNLQPRKHFNPLKHKELVSSIKEKGIMQPILVRPKGDKFEIIAGERRFRAAKEAGFEEMPVLVKEVKDEEALEISLIENIQREELNPMEEAGAYKELMIKFGLKQEDIARAVGKDRSTISNTLRLLNLPKKIQEYVSRETLSAGHARTLLAVDNAKEQIKIAEKIIKKGLSVRETEVLVQRLSGKEAISPKRPKDFHIKDLEEELQRVLGTKVTITQGKKRGKIQLEFYTQSDLQRLIDLLKNR
jgi:ParB family transcriptional regulator, chromosome partitioning protein